MREYSLGPGGSLDASLSEAQVARLVAIGDRRGFARGEILYRQGERARHVLVLVSGTVKASSVSALGQETMLRLHLPGSLLGLTAIAARPRRDATATAVERVEAVSVARERMLGLMTQDGELGVHIAQLLLERLESFQFRVHEVLASPVRQRVARALLDFSAPSGNEPPPGRLLHLSHEELSQIVSARRPTVTQTLREFARAGHIRLDRRRIRVLDAPGLAALVAGGAPAERSSG